MLPVFWLVARDQAKACYILHVKMWHEEQSHLSDQKTFPKKSFGDYVYSKAVQPSDTHVDSFNRFLGKRKLAANDVNLESNIKEFRSPVGVNEQESKNGGHNRKSFAEQTTSSQQAKIDNNYGTDFLEFCLTSGADSGRNATDKLNDASLSVPNTSLCHEEAPFTTVMHVGENVMVLTQQARTCQIEANICSPLPESCKAVSVAVQSDIELRNSKRSRLSNHTTQDNVQQECCHLKFEHLVSVGNSDLGVEINRSNEDSIKSAYSQKDSKYETPYELKESGLCPNTIGTSNPRHTEDCKTLENEVQFRGSMLGFLSSKTYESNDQNDVRSTLKAASPEMKNLKNTSADDILSRNGSRPAILVEDGIVQHGGPSKANENVKLSSEKPVIIVTDQLWDGRVQLSSSVTVSAVAFFKRSSDALLINRFCIDTCAHVYNT